MPSLNQGRYIEDAIGSVLDQNYANTEVVVSDGGSTDGTIDILKRLENNDSRVRWQSSPDNGPSQAINRALRRSRGTVIGWLNSDDLYEPGSIKRAVELLTVPGGPLVAYGNGAHIDADGLLLERYPTRPPNTPLTHFRDGCFICQPTVFFSRVVWLLIGDLNEQLKNAFDLDFWIRIFKKMQSRIVLIDSDQAYSRLHHECITLRSRRAITVESMQVIASHLQYAPTHWLENYLREDRSSVTASENSIEQLIQATSRYVKESERSGLKEILNNVLKQKSN